MAIAVLLLLLLPLLMSKSNRCLFESAYHRMWKTLLLLQSIAVAASLFNITFVRLHFNIFLQLEPRALEYSQTHTHIDRNTQALAYMYTHNHIETSRERQKDKSTQSERDHRLNSLVCFDFVSFVHTFHTSVALPFYFDEKNNNIIRVLSVVCVRRCCCCCRRRHRCSWMILYGNRQIAIQRLM